MDTLVQIFGVGVELHLENWTRWEPVEVVGERAWSWESADPEWWYSFQERCSWLPFTVIITYLTSILVLKQYMKTRPPFQNKTLTFFMVTHNVVSAIFAGLVLWRSHRMFLSALQYPNWFHVLCCERVALTRKDLFWLIGSGWSKVLHLGDTYFLIFKKKNVPLFHLFHHSVMVLVPMLIFPLGEPILHLFGMVNMAQHFITYQILLLKTLKVPLIPGTSTFLLLLELFQMCIGLFAGLYTIYIIKSGGNCVRHPLSLAYFNFIYCVMSILLVKLLWSKFSTSTLKEKKQ